MKIYTRVFYSLFIIIISINLLNINYVKGQTFKDYIQPHGVFSINYPEDWLYKTNGNNIVNFYPPGEESKNSGFAVIYGTTTLKGNLSLEQILKYFKKTLGENFSDLIKIEEQNNIILSDIPAILYHIKMKTNKEKLRKEFLAILAVKNDTIFIIISFSPEDKFSNYLTIYNQMIQSFKSPVLIPVTAKTPTIIPKITNYIKFNDPEKRFQIKYPEEWEISRAETGDKKTIAFNPEGENPISKGLRVTFINMEEQTDLNDSAKKIIDRYKKEITSFQEIEKPEDINIANLSGKQYHIQGEYNGIQIEKIIIITLKENVLMVIECASPVQEFPQFYQTYMEMLESLEIFSYKDYDFTKTLVSSEGHFLINYPGLLKNNISKTGNRTTYLLHFQGEDPYTHGMTITSINMENEKKEIDISKLSESIIYNYQQNFTNIEELEKIPVVTYGNNNWSMLKFKGKKDNIFIENLILMTYKEKHEYIINISRPTGDYDIFIPLFMKAVNEFYFIFPAQIKSWNSFKSKGGEFSIEYPPVWKINQQNSEGGITSLTLYPFEPPGDSGLTISYFRPQAEEQINKPLENIAGDLSREYEALGYELIKQDYQNFNNIPSLVQKVNINDKTKIIITFILEKYIFQIYIPGDENSFNTYNDILKTFRPF